MLSTSDELLEPDEGAWLSGSESAASENSDEDWANWPNVLLLKLRLACILAAEGRTSLNDRYEST